MPRSRVSTQVPLRTAAQVPMAMPMTTAKAMATSARIAVFGKASARIALTSRRLWKLRRR